MVGFDISRFVDLNQSKAQHLKCGICGQIFRNPVITRCGHTFCKECLKIKIQFNNGFCLDSHCEQLLAQKRKRNDKIYINDFCVDNKSLFQIINDLEIKCDFVDKGCKEVVRLALLSDHLDVCDYNLCSDCGLKMGPTDDHNCLQLLKQHLDKEREKSHLIIINLKEEINSLKTQNQLLKNELNGLRSTQTDNKSFIQKNNC
jgi:hypothetical protein